MKLRTYIVLISVGVMLSLLTFFSYQTREVLKDGFGKINSMHVSNITSVATTLIGAKRSYLKSFSRTLETDTDLSGAYVLATESRDYKLLNQKLSNIHSRTDFDIVDILSKKGQAVQNKKLSMKEATIHDALTFRHGILTVGEGSNLTLVALSPLRLYDETVGYVLLGYDLNRLIAKEMENIENARLRFYLPEGKHISEETLAVSRELGLYNENSLPVLLRIETLSSFVGEVDKIVARQLLYFGALSLLFSDRDYLFSARSRFRAKIQSAPRRYRKGDGCLKPWPAARGSICP